jgi:hypothetical protein
MSDATEKKPFKRPSPLMSTIIFIIFAVAVIALLNSVSGDRSPRIPEDEIHKGLNDNQSCMQCHGPGQYAERSPSHPPKDQCILCHKRKRG